MATPDPAVGGPEPTPPAEPTVRVTRPPSLGSPPAAEQPAGDRPPRPAHPDDESTVNLPRPAPRARQSTLQFGTPAPVVVTVSARPRRRRRHRTWPWIAAVVAALLVIGAVLLVMLLRGATVEGRLGAPGADGAAQELVRTTSCCVARVIAT